MSKKTGLTIGAVLVLFTLVVVYISINISVNDHANRELQVIDGMKSKVEMSLDDMNKVIKSQSEVVKGEKEAFLEFQKMVADSKKGQTIGGMLTAIQEKYPDFDIKGFDKLMITIEAKRDEFKIAQEEYNSHVVEYNKFIVGTVNDFFLGDNHKKLDQFVISSKSSKESMSTGIEELEEISL